jgi:oxalate decarboxylase
MTVPMPVDSARTMAFHAKDADTCKGSPLNTSNTGNDSNDIENTGNDDLLFFEIFAAPQFLDISLSQWIRYL